MKLKFKGQEFECIAMGNAPETEKSKEWSVNFTIKKEMETKQELQQELARLEKLTQKVKAKIENALEVGKWYKFGFKGLFCFQGVRKHCYGFDNGGYWSDTLGYAENEGQATQEEVEKALFNEANKRGFKKGVKYKPVSQIGDLKDFVATCIHYPNFLDSYDLYMGYQYIFSDGKWATIITEPEYKDGDIVIASIGPSEYITTFKDKFGSQFNGYNYLPIGSEYIMKSEGAFDSIERYATDEEKELFLSLLNPEPKVGDVVKAWDDTPDTAYIIGRLSKISKEGFLIGNEVWLKNAKTLTQQEVTELLF